MIKPKMIREVRTRQGSRIALMSRGIPDSPMSDMEYGVERAASITWFGKGEKAYNTATVVFRDYAAAYC